MDCKKTRPIVSYPQEDVCPPFTFQHCDRGFPLHSGNWILSMLSPWERPSFCHCSFLPTGACGRCSCTWLSVAPSSSQLRRLRLPFPLTARACRCRRAFDPPGDHRAACPRSGALRSRCTPLEREAARVCSEAGARVTTHTLISNFTIPTIQRIDNRRIEVIAHGLSPRGGSQLAIDTTIVSPLTSQATPRQHRGQHAGAALRHARRSKERTCPELVHPARCHLVVFGVEAGRRWSEEAAGFTRQLAKARARQSPDPLRQAVTAALIARWSSLLAHATFTAVAASLLCEDTSFHNNVDGFLAPRSEIFAHMRREPAAPQPNPSPLWRSIGLDLATPPFVAWRFTSKTVISLPGDWPVQQSKTEALR